MITSTSGVIYLFIIKIKLLLPKYRGPKESCYIFKVKVLMVESSTKADPKAGAQDEVEKKLERKRTKTRDEDPHKEKEIKKLKRHNATVLYVYSHNGIDGTEFVSCSADHIVRGKLLLLSKLNGNRDFSLEI